MTTGELEALLRARLPAEEWALFFEVRNGTGYARKTVRTADAIAMSTWPSRGLELHGFELKVSRADWQRELANPAKAEEIARFCDRWWLVVGDADIVQPGELPVTWGLLAPNKKGKLAAVTEAPKLPNVQPADRLFLASLLRAAHDCSPGKQVIAGAVEVATKELHERHQRQRDSQVENLKHALEELQRGVREFEEKSGVSIRTWDAGRIGAAVKFVVSGGFETERRKLLDLQRQARQAADYLDQLISDPAKPGSAA